MALHIRDPETDALVRKLASARGIGLTEAVREAVQNELSKERALTPLAERIKPILAEINKRPGTGLEADKAFYDWLSGEDEN